MDLGACLIAPYWGAWSEQIEIFTRGRFTLAKIYTPQGHWFDPSHARDLIDAGATTIILCGEGCDPTRERTRADFVGRGWYEFIRENDDIKFWIEVGNEANKCEPPIHMSRYRPMVLETISLKAELPAPNLRWLVSLPTKLDQVRALLTGGDIERAFDGLATHAYGFERIEDGGADDWLSILSLILKQSRLPIYLTEVGIHAPALPKREKADRIMAWLGRIDAGRIQGATIFAIGTGTQWPEYEIGREMAGQFATWQSEPEPEPRPEPEPTPPEQEQPMSAQIPGFTWHPAAADHFTRGRSQPIRGGAQHYTGGTDSLAWLTTTSRPPVSAHFLIRRNATMEDRGQQLVRIEDTAWATSEANPYTVAIEYEHLEGQDIPDGDYEVMAQTWADISRYVDVHGFGQITPDRRGIQGHREWQGGGTICPDGIDVDRIATRVGELMTRECIEFPETGHKLCRGFLAYWETYGGLAIFGYPITDEYTDPETGLVTQYFERARFEWHPGKWPERFDVLLGLVGAEALAAKGS